MRIGARVEMLSLRVESIVLKTPLPQFGVLSRVADVVNPFHMIGSIRLYKSLKS